SLVEHRHGTENPSLIPGRTGRDRRAYMFLGEDNSAADIDWATPARWETSGMATFVNIRSPHLAPTTVPDGSPSCRRLERLSGIWKRIDDAPTATDDDTTPDEPAPVDTTTFEDVP